MKTFNTTKSYQNERIDEAGGGDACAGQVVWSPVKSIWITTMYVLAIVGGVWTYSVEALAVFLFTSAVTLCLGHSLGMHRKLIHHSFDCPKWLEYLLVHFGTVVGLAGPRGMMQVHDIRDWAQRQPKCHDFFSHQQAKPIDWVIWGICVRVAVCVTGHWLIGYMAHNNGGRHWHVEGASVQGYNIKFAALTI
jgi:fatty-acid desaturase